MSVTNIILSVVLLILVAFISPNLRQLAATGISLWIWLLCVCFSGLIGEFVGAAFGRNVLRGHFFDSGFLQNLLACYFIVASVAVLAFIVLYRFAAYSLFSFIEQTRKVELARPSVKLGAVLAIFSPFAIDYIISAFKMSR